MDSIEQRRQNDLKGLKAIEDFGWLRAHELAKLMWPKNKSNKEQADRLVRSWEERRLVLTRKLPDRAGRAVVLATAGVRLLAEDGIDAASGKDIGVLRDGKWEPPRDWKHHLLAAGALLHLSEMLQNVKGIIPERSIRKAHPRLSKIPDGMLILEGGVVWLEVESAAKKGKEMERLADALRYVSEGEAPVLLGHKPNVSMVAFRDDAKDTRGYKLAHQQYVRRAISIRTTQPSTVFWATCKVTQSLTIESLELKKETIDSDKALAIKAHFDRWGWHTSEDTEGILFSRYGDHVVHVFKDENGDFYWRLKGESWTLAENISDAKMQCANRVARLLSQEST